MPHATLLVARVVRFVMICIPYQLLSVSVLSVNPKPHEHDSMSGLAVANDAVSHLGKSV